jgi:hypothetical protein
MHGVVSGGCADGSAQARGNCLRCSTAGGEPAAGNGGRSPELVSARAAKAQTGVINPLR